MFPSFFKNKQKVKNCDKCGCSDITDWAKIDCNCKCHDSELAGAGMTFLLSPKKSD